MTPCSPNKWQKPSAYKYLGVFSVSRRPVPPAPPPPKNKHLLHDGLAQGHCLRVGDLGVPGVVVHHLPTAQAKRNPAWKLRRKPGLTSWFSEVFSAFPGFNGDIRRSPGYCDPSDRSVCRHGSIAWVASCMAWSKSPSSNKALARRKLALKFFGFRASAASVSWRAKGGPGIFAG